jgi:hypothetical protein
MAAIDILIAVGRAHHSFHPSKVRKIIPAPASSTHRVLIDHPLTILRQWPEYRMVDLRAEHWAVQKGDGAQA